MLRLALSQTFSKSSRTKLSPLLRINSRLFSNSLRDNIAKSKQPPKAKNSTPKPKRTPLPEEAVGTTTSNKFQARTSEILSIVSHSIYTNKEIFLRELISNASDAIEQLRFQILKSNGEGSLPSSLQISITTDAENRRLIISDNGVGMTKTQLIENLGTIAKSGSKRFVESLKDEKSAASIIGQFGVGFYSSFMVSQRVEVFTRSRAEGAEELYWVSDGKGEFSISQARNVSYGTKIVVNLTEENLDYCNEDNVEKIVKRHSNFVRHPILLNGKRLNLHGPLWQERNVSAERHADFYKYLTNAYDAPLITLHFHKDLPLNLHALLYIPQTHNEKYGNARMKPGVDIYSRNVLIRKQSPDILPDWLRFIRGVIDSEDLLLNISREATQDPATLARLRRTLVKAVIAHLRALAKKDNSLFLRFYNEFFVFLKEGICSDIDYKDLLAPLLRFETSRSKQGSLYSLEDYVGAMASSQKKIYYLVSSDRSAALRSPYFEALRKAGREVIFFYSPIDEFVMTALGSYEKRPLVSIESKDVDAEDMDEFDDAREEFALSAAQTEDLCEWMKGVLGDRVKKVVASKRLRESAAIITGHENASVQMMMRMANNGEEVATRPQTLEVNPAHRVVRGIFYAMQDDAKVARVVAQQLMDNALMEAGLLKDARSMLTRGVEIMAAALDVDGIEIELREKKEKLAGKNGAK